jgi:hypothetical protein
MPANVRLACDYATLVRRAEERPHVGFRPIVLRDRPLLILGPRRADHPDARLDLQEVLDHIDGGSACSVYDDSRAAPVAGGVV